MDIEDIINRARYTSPKSSQSDRWRLTCDVTELHGDSHTQRMPETIDQSKKLLSSGNNIYLSEGLQPVHREQDEDRPRSSESRHIGCSLSRQRRAGTVSDFQVSPLPTQWSAIPTIYPGSAPNGHFTAHFCLRAYTDVLTHVPFQSQFTVQPSILTRQQQRQQLQMVREEISVEPAVQKGVRLPPLPESLRRPQAGGKRRHVPANRKKRRIRRHPVVGEYDHLSLEQTIKELARRDIHVTDLQSATFDRTDLSRLLQRADRNNNKGSILSKDTG